MAELVSRFVESEHNMQRSEPTRLDCDRTVLAKRSISVFIVYIDNRLLACNDKGS